MSAPKKMTVKSLSEEFYKLKDEVKELATLKNKIFELESALKQCNDEKEILKTLFEALEYKIESVGLKDQSEKIYSRNVNECQKCYESFTSKNELKKHMNEQHKSLKCRKCETPAESEKELKKHIKEKHPVKLKCKVCEEAFEKNSDLELHLKNMHGEKENHECDQCGKTFVLEWRLKKHMGIHYSAEIKGCHYFNNAKKCPYENIGCMFSHHLSGLCKYDKFCKNKLCSFQHESESEDRFSCQECELKFTNENTLTKHVETKHDNEKNDDDESYPCDTCENIYKEIEDLIDHYGETAHNN